MAKDSRADYAEVPGALCGPPQKPPGKRRVISIQEYLPAGRELEKFC